MENKKIVRKYFVLIVIALLILLINFSSYAKILSCKGFKEEGIENGVYYTAPYYEKIKLEYFKNNKYFYFIIKPESINVKKTLVGFAENGKFSFADTTGKNFMFGTYDPNYYILSITNLDQVMRDLVYTFHYNCYL